MSWIRIISLVIGFMVMDALIDILMLTIWTRHHLDVSISIKQKKEQINGKEEDSDCEEQC